MMSWLGTHGNCLIIAIDLQLAPFHTLVGLPPCARLRSLQVANTGVRLCPANSAHHSSGAGSSSISTSAGNTDAQDTLPLRHVVGPGIPADPVVGPHCVQQGCSGLTRLVLWGCELANTYEQLAALSALGDLQQLYVAVPSARKHLFRAHMLQVGTLAGLTQLSYLSLGYPLLLPALSALAPLTGLAHLSLRVH